MATTLRSALLPMVAFVFLAAGCCADTHAQSPSPEPKTEPKQQAEPSTRPAQHNPSYSDPLEDPIVVRPTNGTAQPSMVMPPAPSTSLPCLDKECTVKKTKPKKNDGLE